MTVFRHAARKLGPWILVLGLVTSLGISQVSGKVEPLTDKPVYHPESKSYFELVQMKGIYKRNWRHALEYASKRVYKGTRGHLAIVDSPELHEFLRQTFRSNRQTWIGLRYWCAFRKLQWVNGKTMNRGDFKAWNAQWDLSGSDAGCRGTRGEYMPIFYTANDRGFRWAAQGIAKNWHYYFVQYRTGEE